MIEISMIGEGFNFLFAHIRAICSTYLTSDQLDRELEISTMKLL